MLEHCNPAVPWKSKGCAPCLHSQRPGVEKTAMLMLSYTHLPKARAGASRALWLTSLILIISTSTLQRGKEGGRETETPATRRGELRADLWQRHT